MSTPHQTEKLEFQAQVKQLLHLVTHSLYSNREIFLRELISNASDALDRLRYASLTDPNKYPVNAELKIKLSVDPTQKTLTITDNGIGMDRAEIIKHLGTIAHSGTKEFFNSLTGNEAKDAQLIGQFGVGFYSAFMVADKVIVRSRRADLGADAAVEWSSFGDGEYTVETITQAEAGTNVILHFKADAEEFLQTWRLRQIIHKYSDHIAFPIIMQQEQFGEEQAAEPKDEQVNQATALWTRSKQDLSETEYREFYKHIAHDSKDPLAYSHNRVEGKLEYTILLYIPAQAPFDLWNRDAKHGLKLYVQRVFIMDDVAQFLPFYLRFVRGIVDSNDLPLNVSREILQSGNIVDSIKSAITKKVIGMLENLATNEAEKYQLFWQEFGRVLKEGPVEDWENREKIVKLLRFASTHSNQAEQNVSLDDYVSRMLPGQDKIYYVLADTFAAAKNSPYLEKLRKKGIEVLLLSDRIDGWLTAHVTEYQGKALQSVAKADLDLGGLADQAETAEHEKQATEYAELSKRVKEALGNKVKEVRISTRLSDSPACIVIGQHDVELQVQRLMRATGQTMPETQPILELNPDHGLIKKLSQENDPDKFQDWAEILFDQAVLAESGQLDDPASFVRRINKLLA